MSTFPPSSPLLEHIEHDVYDPFSSFSGPSTVPKKLVINTPFSKDQTKQVTQAYPTPNPSSSAGRSSSPARQQVEFPLPRSDSNASADEPKSTTKDALAASTITSKPALSVLLYPGEKVSIGRSSRCDYFIKCKFASREHLKLHYDLESNELTVLCKGYNGAEIHLGLTHYGYINESPDKVFTFVEKTKEEATEEDEVVDSLALWKDEQLTVPYNDRMTLEIKGSFIAVAITNEESETEDEMPVLTKRLSSIEPTEQMKKNAVPETTEAKKQVEVIAPVTAPTRAPSKITTLQTPLNKPIKPLELAPVKHLSRTSTPVLMSSVDIETPSLELENELERAKSVEPEHTIKRTTTKHHAHQRSKSTEIKVDNVLRAPLQPKTQNEINKQNQNRRRKAEPGSSPQKKKLDTKQQVQVSQEPRQKIESMNLKEILATVEDFETVQNVLTNHLAFSRLSQTPLKQLQSISVSTQALSRQQLRAILASTEWIGVIYRKGKDAAGKHLDEEYYYDVEHDKDFSRVEMVSSIKGSSGLRNCRKTHKQYFWKKPVSRK